MNRHDPQKPGIVAAPMMAASPHHRLFWCLIMAASSGWDSSLYPVGTKLTPQTLPVLVRFATCRQHQQLVSTQPGQLACMHACMTQSLQGKNTAAVAQACGLGTHPYSRCNCPQSAPGQRCRADVTSRQYYREMLQHMPATVNIPAVSLPPTPHACLPVDAAVGPGAPAQHLQQGRQAQGREIPVS